MKFKLPVFFCRKIKHSLTLQVCIEAAGYLLYIFTEGASSMLAETFERKFARASLYMLYQ